jgi:recombination protein RecT
MGNDNTNGQVTKQVTKIDSLKKMLEAPSVQEQFQNALSENTGPFIASIIDLFNGDSNLQACDPKAVVMEALKAAILKLPIIKSLGFAYIVPFKKNNVPVPQFQIGYKGLIQLALRTGEYRIINADEVFEGEYISRNKLTGEFDLSGEKKSDRIIGYFAHFEMKNGFSKTLYSTVEKVTAHAQKYSKSFNMQFSPWKTEFDAMAKKTVLRGLLGHWGILSVEMINALTDDDDVADNVKREIATNGNQQENKVGFEEAELVDETKGSGPAGNNLGEQNGGAPW